MEVAKDESWNVVDWLAAGSPEYSRSLYFVRRRRSPGSLGSLAVVGIVNWFGLVYGDDLVFEQVFVQKRPMATGVVDRGLLYIYVVDQQAG